MIGDADDAWRAGLDVLAATPLALPAYQARHSAKDDLAARAQRYGEILVTCVACHTAPRREP
jgi:mono/diheme cytochrome c family protein